MMKGLFDTLINAFRVPDLRKKLLYTLSILAIYMVGGLIPSPAIDQRIFTDLVQNWGQIGGLMDIISAGNLYNATIFAMGITPYINSSIIMQLLTVAIPALERMQKEGETGRKKIQKIVRFVTIGLALLQASVFCYATRTAMTDALPQWMSAILIILTFTAGTAFIMWLGERINEKGIGNGISLIIFAGIATRLPSMAGQLFEYAKDVYGRVNTFAIDGFARIKNAVLGFLAGGGLFVVISLVSVAIIVFVVYVQNAERRVPVQYSKRVIGRKVYGGQNSYIPLKVNQSGVMPVIFTMSMIALPSTIVTMFFQTSTHPIVEALRNPAGHWWYYAVNFLLIIGFTFFYSAIQFNPIEISNNLQKNGGYIPGVRPGRPTSDFIARTAGRLNWADALFLSIVVLVPTILGKLTNLENVVFAGTSVLILTGVANDLVKQIESQMVTHHYKGFLD